MKRVGHVVFIEDKFYLLWQLELFLYSIISRGKIDPCDIVVLHADPSYHNHDVKWDISPYLTQIIKHYPCVKFFPVQNWGRSNWYYRFQGNGVWHPKQYAGINKWLSLCEAANTDWLDEFDEIVLLEQDLWFSGQFPKLPVGNCVTANWLCNRHKAFAVSDKSKDENTNGFDLDDIMSLCKVPKKYQKLWTSGAIIFKFLIKDLKNTKFLNAISNYNQLLMTLGELALPQGARHETDMVAPSLAMAHCGMKCKTIDDQRWRSDIWVHNNEPLENTVVHYGWDFSHHPHLNSSFAKSNFNDKAPWHDVSKFKDEYEQLKFNWTKLLYEDLFSLNEVPMNRECNRQAHQPVI
jgi:hypothetical protein